MREGFSNSFLFGIVLCFFQPLFCKWMPRHKKNLLLLMRCKGNWILDALSKIVDLRGTWILCQNVLQNSFYLLSSLKPLIQNDILVKNVIHKKREEVHEGIDILLQVDQEKASSSRVRATGTSAGHSAYRSKRSRR